MAYPTVPNTFQNGSGNTIDATEMNANFTALENGFSDGTKDLNMDNGAFGGTLSASGRIVPSVDVSNITWQDFSGSSVITGWSSYSTKEIYYKLIGNVYVVNVNIVGTSDATAVTFTLPASAASGSAVRVASEFKDNDAVSTTPGKMVLDSPDGSVKTAAAYTNWGSGAWTNSNGKYLICSFVYERDR